MTGPSLCVLIVAELNFDDYTDAMGENRWPVDRCRIVAESPEAFMRVARDVAFSMR